MSQQRTVGGSNLAAGIGAASNTGPGNTTSKASLGFFESFILSGTAAGVAKTSAAPIERVKLLLQNQNELIKQVYRRKPLSIKLSVS